MMHRLFLICLLVFGVCGSFVLSGASDEAPSGREILKRYVEARGVGWSEVKSILAVGKMEIPKMGLKGDLLVYREWPDKIYTQFVILNLLDSGEALIMEHGCNGKVCWESNSGAGTRFLEGKEKTIKLFFSHLDLYGQPEKYFPAIDTVGTDEVDGEPCDKVKFTVKGIEDFSYTLYFSKAAHLVVKKEFVRELEIGPVPHESFSRDYREVEGLKLPFLSIERGRGTAMQVIIESYEINAKVPEGIFEAPEEVNMAAVANRSVVAEGAKIEKLAGGFKFTEGPASDKQGNVYFTDIPNERIHLWSVKGGLSTFREKTGRANGLYFDRKGNLLVCEGGNRRVVTISPKGKVTILAERYKGKRFNSPNDLWVDLQGGIYFSDPRYGKREGMELEKESVYYIRPGSKEIVRVINDMVRPNGLVGTANGQKLYVTDAGGKKTYVYTIGDDGQLANKKLFAEQGSDGMTLDEKGNVYLTGEGVVVYDSKGELIERIEVPERPSNVCFGGKDNQTLFITARSGFYAIRMRVKGVF